ncbi:MAG: ABC transporter ATP-binding protein [Candidatus Methylomirabilales bacterium]
MSGGPMLEVQDLVAGYGPARVLHGVSLRVGPGEAVALLGRNGAGKSTTLKAVMGLLPAEAGRIRFLGRDVSRLPPYARCRSGMGYVPQERRIFPDLTVLENLEVGRRPGPPAWTAERVLALFPALRPLAGRRGGMLSGGEQQMLAIGRTLMGGPRLLLLDEPSEGLAPRLADALSEQVLRLKREGLAILLSEQNLRFTLRVGDRAYVLENGSVRHEASMAALAADENVRRRHLMI